MGRRSNKRMPRAAAPVVAPEFERTLAAAEEESAFAEVDDFACPCGSKDFLLEAFLHVVDGHAKPDPVEVDALTCPKCGREFDAVQLEGGRSARGDFRGWTDVDEDDDD